MCCKDRNKINSENNIENKTNQKIEEKAENIEEVGCDKRIKQLFLQEKVKIKEVMDIILSIDKEIFYNNQWEMIIILEKVGLSLYFQFLHSHFTSFQSYLKTCFYYHNISEYTITIKEEG